MLCSKICSFLSNLLPFGIYCLTFLLINDYNWIYRGIFICIVVIQVICCTLLKKIVNFESGKYSESTKEYKIVRISRDRTSSLNFIVTNVFPLISLDFNNLGMILFCLFIVIIIGILFFKNNLYLYNPILEISGYKIYNIELQEIPKTKEITENVISKTLLSLQPIPLNKKIYIKEFEDDIAF